MELEIDGFGVIEVDGDPSILPDVISRWHSNPAAGQFYDGKVRGFNPNTKKIIPVEPSLRDRVYNRAVDFFTDPEDDPIARQTGLRRANAIVDILDIFPGSGDALMVSDANRAFQDESYLEAAILTGASALGIVPVIGDAGAKALKNPQVREKAAEVVQKLNVWHGSPHKFDKFSLDHIGTGEGAQAYGHGLYFAGSKAVAQDYADNVVDLSRISGINEELRSLSGVMDADSAGGYRSFKSSIGEDASQRYDALMAERAELRQAQNNMYNVDLNVNPDHLLDWDKPLRESSSFDQIKSVEGDDFGGYMTPQEYMNTFDSPEHFSAKMKEVGIPGIRYLDGSSRAAGEGTSNYVIFDDSLVDIKARNGELLQGLGMSQDARMQRARDMGFDTDTVWYHGTDKDFDEFSKDAVGDRFEKYSFGTYLTDDPDIANEYAKESGQYLEGGRVLPLHTRTPKNPLHVNATGMNPAAYIDINRAEIIEKVVESRRAGNPIDSVIATNDNRGNSVAVMFDLEDIRSTFADFDPAKKESSNILASPALVGLGALGAARYMSEEESDKLQVNGK